MRIPVSMLMLCALPVSAQSAPPQTDNHSAESILSLEHYRETMIPVYMNDFGQLGRYRDANAALSAPKPGEQRVIFFGDSITDGWHLDEYFPGKGYINRGIGGQTTSQMLIRFHQHVIDLKPAVVVILAGTNDIAGNTGAISVPDIEKNYEALAELARAHQIRMVFSLELNAWLKNYCAKNGEVYLDYFAATVDGQGLLKKDLAVDGLHPNDAGYKIMAPLAEAANQQALAKR